MEWIYTFGIVFIIIFSIFYIITRIEISKNNLGLNQLSLVLINKYQLKLNDKQKRQLMLDEAFYTSIILTIPITLVIRIKMNYLMIAIISILIFISLMLIFYDLIGKKYKKESEKNGNRRNKKN